MEIAGARPHLAIEPRHGFEIVVEDIRLGRDDHLDRTVLAQKIRYQHLNRRGRRGGADRGNSQSEMPGTAVVEIVTIDRGHDDMLKAERGDRLPDPPGLVRVELVGPAGRDIAEGAGAGANGA